MNETLKQPSSHKGHFLAKVGSGYRTVVLASDHDAKVAELQAALANMQAQRDRIAENLRFERELKGGYPFNPTEAQWGGLARDIVWWMRSYPSNKHTPATLMEHLGNLGREVPAWMGDEAELRTQDHVISKGTIAVLIYKAMLAAYDPFELV